jgi:hypothetical protein
LLGEIRIEDVVGLGHRLLVEAVIARLVAADEQDSLPARVEGVEDAKRSAA